MQVVIHRTVGPIKGFTFFDTEIENGADHYGRRIFRLAVDDNGVVRKATRLTPRYAKTFDFARPKTFRKIAVGNTNDEVVTVATFLEAAGHKIAVPVKSAKVRKPYVKPAPDTRDFAAIFFEAKIAAQEAVKAIVDAHTGPGPVDHVGACGFAWVRLPKAQGPFVTWLKKAAKGAVDSRAFGERAWDVGWEFWNPGDYRGQRIDIKEAGAAAFAAVLKKHGIACYTGSRLD